MILWTIPPERIRMPLSNNTTRRMTSTHTTTTIERRGGRCSWRRGRCAHRRGREARPSSRWRPRHSWLERRANDDDAAAAGVAAFAAASGADAASSAGDYSREDHYYFQTTIIICCSRRDRCAPKPAQTMAGPSSSLSWLVLRDKKISGRAIQDSKSYKFHNLHRRMHPSLTLPFPPGV